MRRTGERPLLVGAVLALCLLAAINISLNLRYTESSRPTSASRATIARARENADALSDALRAADRQAAGLSALLGAVGTGARGPLLAAGSSADPLALADGAQAAAVAALAPRAPVWLRIVMPCHSRQTGVNYLRATLASILQQLPPGDPLRALVDVLVVNTDAHPADNTAFADVRAELAGEPLMRFVQLESRRYASLKPSRSSVKPSVQQQTLDLAEVFAVADALLPRAELVLAAEDDWLL
jgi:hypothetical protein